MEMPALSTYRVVTQPFRIAVQSQESQAGRAVQGVPVQFRICEEENSYEGRSHWVQGVECWEGRSVTVDSSGCVRMFFGFNLSSSSFSKRSISHSSMSRFLSKASSVSLAESTQ